MSLQIQCPKRKNPAHRSVHELEHARNTRERKETKRKGMGSEGDEPGQFDCGDVIVAWCMGARVFFLPLARLKFTIYFCKLFYTF